MKIRDIAIADIAGVAAIVLLLGGVAYLGAEHWQPLWGLVKPMNEVEKAANAAEAGWAELQRDRRKEAQQLSRLSAEHYDERIAAVEARIATEGKTPELTAQLEQLHIARDKDVARFNDAEY